MDDLKDKAKDLMKSFKNPFRTGPQKFQGQGRRLGGGAFPSSSSEPSAPTNSLPGPSQRTKGLPGGVSTGGGPAYAGDSASGPQRIFQPQQQSPSSLPAGTATQSGGGAAVGGTQQRDGGEQTGAVRHPGPEPPIRGPAGSCSSSSGGSGSCGQQSRREQEARPPNSHITGEVAEAWSIGGRPAELANSAEVASSAPSLRSFRCPVCEQAFPSEAHVSQHVDSCLANSLGSSLSDGTGRAADGSGAPPVIGPGADTRWQDLHDEVAAFLSAGPPPATVEVLARLLRNVATNPQEEKFRRVRLSNPRIASTVGAAPGALEVLRAAGFELKTVPGGEGGGGKEMWAVLEGEPEEALLAEAHRLLEEGGGLAAAGGALTPVECGQPAAAADVDVAPPPPPPPPRRLIDRQVQVFMPTSEQMAARIEVPDSFFARTAAEVRAEAAARKKQLENSQLLVTKAWRDKQAALGKRRYNTAVMRVHFPDGLVLQGLFLPSEPTSALYEFVSEALADPGVEFQLAFPFPTKSPYIPSVAAPRAPIPSLEEADLVPASLIKFRPLELSRSRASSWLAPRYLAMARPLTPSPLPPAVER